MMNRRRRSLGRKQHGFLLIALLALLAMGGLYFFISNLTPEAIATLRKAKTDAALVQAREALIGYALQFRDLNPDSGGKAIYMYGHLPLPDLGSSRINTTDPSCKNPLTGKFLEGCDAANFGGNHDNFTVIGRFPWRKLGIEPLRDGWSECLWYAVSGSHQDYFKQSPMNWDTLGQLDLVTASGGAELMSQLTTAHDRPIAIIFSAGPILPGQDRSISETDDVSQCGGNYTVSNYLDPGSVAMGATKNYFTDDPYMDASIPPKPRYASPKPDDVSAPGKLVKLSTQGPIYKTDSQLTSNSCPTCELVANDQGLALTADMLFGALRKSSNFRTDINSMLERMSTCLRDKIAASTTIAPAKIGDDACYGDAKNPQGYFSHYRDQVFAASGAFSGTLDSVSGTNCAGVLILGGQRGAGQNRISVADKAAASNYLEAPNVSIFDGSNGLAFNGPSQFVRVSPTQIASQDIVRCIPEGASLAVVAPTVAASAGNIQLAAYAPATSLLTLGSANISSNYGAAAAQLFACAWTPEAHAGDRGFRSYFRFRIRRVGEGFTFAVIDGDRNGADVCGAARQHLGYSGYNGITPYIQPPKLAIEFDFSRNCNSRYIDANGLPACTFVEAAYTDSNTLSNGRNDPCYTCGTGTTDRHIAVVYWGYGSALNYPTQDDNVHDQADDNSGATPSTPMPTDPSPRPAPRNPAPVLPYVPDPAVIPGVAPLNRDNFNDMSQREFHARVEVTRAFTAPTDAKDGRTGVEIKFWIEPQPAKSISAMSYNSGSPPTLAVTAASHGLTTGDIVVIRDAVPTGYNGEYPVTKIDANNFTATLPNGKANPGRYISAITWTDVSFGTDYVTVTSPNHGHSSWDSVTISGAIPVEYNGTYTIFRIDANSYWFPRNLSYQPGPLPPAVATAKALAPRAQALTNTTRPMSQLYPGNTPDTTFNPLVADTATIYDEQTVACGAGCPSGQTCGSDDMCYRPSFRNLRLGFTLSERPTTGTGSSSARGQLIDITDRATTWLP